MALAIVALAVSCRERPGAYQVEPEQDDRPGPRIVTMPYMVATIPPAPPPPVNYAVVRRDIEARAPWGRLRKGACPRIIIDRIEERRLHPLIDVLESLKYSTVTEGQSYGNYVKISELSALGRQALGGHLVEEAER